MTHLRSRSLLLLQQKNYTSIKKKNYIKIMMIFPTNPNPTILVYDYKP